MLSWAPFGSVIGQSSTVTTKEYSSSTLSSYDRRMTKTKRGHIDSTSRSEEQAQLCY